MKLHLSKNIYEKGIYDFNREINLFSMRILK